MTLRRREDRKNKFFLPRIFSSKERESQSSDNPLFNSSMEFERSQTFSANSSVLKKSFLETQSSSRLENSSFSGLRSQMSNPLDVQPFRVFVATWNVGGNTPHSGLKLDDFLPVEDQADIYVLGFQEIVPLNAGNVLVIEDNEPAAKWLALINDALNKSAPPVESLNRTSTSSDYSTSFSSQASGTKPIISRDSKHTSGLLFFQKPSLKTYSNNFRTVKGRLLKTCNCTTEFERKYSKESCFKCPQSYVIEENSSSEEEDGSNSFVATDIPLASSINNQHLTYSLIVCKQMVGIFLTIWVRKELVQHVGHLRLSCIGRGIMGYLGNKGCISVSMSLYQTSFCVVCSHLASGEKEGDELRRNSDVIEILKNTQFPRICKIPGRRIPEKIIEHDRIIWLGDLNYRIALSYSETRKLLEQNDWDALLEKDQAFNFLKEWGSLYTTYFEGLSSFHRSRVLLKIERDAGRVFKEWNEGKIYFAPTYKYSNNSDVYAGETYTSKKKRRTPAWCDRILWHGDGIEQLSYIRGESRFSDHRPVCAAFVMEIGVAVAGRSKRGSPSSNMKVEVEELLPPRTRFLQLVNMY